MHVAIDGRPVADRFPGIGRYVYNLIAALLRQPQPPLLSVLYDPAQPSTRFDLPALARQHPALRLLPVSAGIARGAWGASRSVRGSGADLQHSTFYLHQLAGGRPNALTLYDAIPLTQPQAMPSLLGRLAYRATVQLALRRAGIMLAISNVAARDISRCLGVPAERFVVTPLAADTHFRPISNHKMIEEWRRKAGLPPRFALYVGTNKPHKNLLRLVQAWQLIDERWPAQAGDLPKLVIAGMEDPRYPQARHAAGLDDPIIFLGVVPEDQMPLLYNAAELFVFPSLLRGFRPAAARGDGVRRAGGLLEPFGAARVAGAAAALFDPEDVEEMASVIGGSYATRRSEPTGRSSPWSGGELLVGPHGRADPGRLPLACSRSVTHE